MVNDFFQLGAIPIDALTGQYNTHLVILSYIVATLASYIALDITGRLRDAYNSKLTNVLWLCGGAFAMGAGIWSMHFIGMLAFSMPSMAMSYDLFWTGLSMVVAVLASSFALFLLKEPIIHVPRLALGGVILGFGIAAMHYLGMEAMKEHMNIHYLPNLFAISIVIAIVASEAALWLAIKSNKALAKYRIRMKIISALIMGAAICGMHYMGMAAAVFTSNGMTMHHTNTIDPQILAIAIAGVTFIILGIAFFLSTYKEAMAANQLASARQAGMTEVATSVLHNVGNILNSVNVSVALLNEKISNSRLEGLRNLNQLIEENKIDLTKFMANDPRGKQIPDYIKMLALCWTDEKNQMTQELSTLIKNIEHIKHIITMQQELGKVTGIEQDVTMLDAIEESLLITNLKENKLGIEIALDLSANDILHLDKVKLMQILVNLLQNAKEAVTSNNNLYKHITITTGKNNQHECYFKITDNGVGILPENLIRIFSYGFTTKKSGHGFGLHSCALAANEMNGAIQAFSQGEYKGASFVLTLPC